jgi:hypothetical protein
MHPTNAAKTMPYSGVRDVSFSKKGAQKLDSLQLAQNIAMFSL